MEKWVYELCFRVMEQEHDIHYRQGRLIFHVESGQLINKGLGKASTASGKFQEGTPINRFEILRGGNRGGLS